MISINRLLEALEPHVVNRWLHFRPGRNFLQIHVLDGQPISQRKLLYVGTPDTFVQAADHLPEGGEKLTFVLAGSSPALSAYKDRQEFNLIVTSLTLAALCNLLYQIDADYNLWIQSMNRHLYAKPDLPALLECGAKKLGGYTCLLDASGKLLCASPGGAPPVPLLREMAEAEHLTLDGMKELETARAAAEGDWFPMDSPAGAWSLCIRAIRYKGQTVSHHIIALPGPSCAASSRELASRFQNLTVRFVLSYNHDKYETDNALSTLVADLIEGRLTESEQLVGRIKQLPVHIKKYYHCVVVEPEIYVKPAHLGRLIRELEQIFPAGLITTYQGNVVILAWKLHHYADLVVNLSDFQAVLERYDARACIGNFTRWLSSLRHIYLQTKGVIQYARVFCPDPHQRIYRFEDYSMYQIVGLCVDNCRNFHGGDPVYLCHPGVVTLATHDFKNGTNLFQVLYTYLKNDRNLTQTARELFFHRNTLQHKIEKIESILGESLDSSIIRQRLLFSCMVLEYIRRYQKRDDVLGYKRSSPPTSALIQD